MEPPAELELLEAWPIDGSPGVPAADLQPSGLLLVGGRLLAVSDRHDSVVFALEVSGAKVHALPWLEFQAPALAPRSPARLDFEGLATDRAGALLLLSEALFRALRVLEGAQGGAGPRAGRAAWLGADGGLMVPGPELPSVEELGHAAGFFGVAGADLEGLAVLPDGALLLAAERQPRGLIELSPPDEAQAKPGTRVWAMPESAWPVPRNRPADFSDLSIVDGRLYALVRNAHLVVRLERTTQGWREERAWSYAAAENDSRFVYADTTFGLGEGLAIGEHEIFIVLDNNGQARVAAPGDRRALLFRFARPSEL